jgi:hypothetical protein
MAASYAVAVGLGSEHPLLSTQLDPRFVSLTSVSTVLRSPVH